MQCNFCIQVSTKRINLMQSQFRTITFAFVNNTSKSRYILNHHQPSMSRYVSSSSSKKNWSILKDICNKDLSGYDKYACLLLNINNESYKHFERFKFIWDQANLRIAVDGSANALAEKEILNTADIVCGDFDSIEKELVGKLKGQRSNKLDIVTNKEENQKVCEMPMVIELPCQEETDFTKALKLADSLKPDIKSFIALYYTNGKRMDHLLSLINTLHTSEQQNIIIINIYANTVSWVLRPGQHTIEKLARWENCSLVPFTGPTQVQTEGLKYNLDHESVLEFGRMISTSNQSLHNRDRIIVKTNRKLLWSMDLSSF